MPSHRTLLAAIASTASAVASVVALAVPANAGTCEGTITAAGKCEFVAQDSCPTGSDQTDAFSDGRKVCERPL